MTETNQRGLIKENYYLKTFFWGLFLAFLLFIPFIIRDEGIFYFYGDFNVQQIPFYRHAHDMVRSGNFNWSHLTDLGTSFIPSYTFYLLGSPFFWLTIPFPNEMVPHLMGPLLMLKFACAGLTAFVYLNRYVKNQNLAMMGGILYAFSGYSVYNIFFNHFHESVIVLPLMLWAIDEYAHNRRRGLIAVVVFMSVTMNYYFFVGQVIFCVIYFFLRLGMGSYKMGVRDFLLMVFEVMIGVGIGAFLLLPSVLMILGNPRVSNPIEGWNALIHNPSQRYVHIIQSMFFPPDLPARANFTPDSSANWASLGAWLPLFGMTGTIAWLQVKRKHWLKRIIYILFICAMVPVLNSMFQLFNASYYARWFYMPVLMFVLATVMSLESKKVDWKRAIKWNFVIVLIIGFSIGMMPNLEDIDGVEVLTFGLEEYTSRFWTYVAISVLCLAILVLIFRFTKKEKFVKNLIRGVFSVSVIYAIFFVALGKTQSLDPLSHIAPYSLDSIEDLQLEDIDVARSDFYESLDNSGMYWKIPTINAFHSVVSPSIMEFYQFIGIQRDVGSRPETSHYALRGLTSVKWLFDDEDDSDYFAGEEYDDPKIDGFSYYGNDSGFDIWENDYYIPMGFSYDYYITESDAEDLSKSSRELMMLKAAIIPDEDEEIWAEHIREIAISDVSYSKNSYYQDCEDRASTSASQFHYTTAGFEAVYNAEITVPVFFSVPYDDGWSATVNGRPAEILKTNIGFMSVIVPEGSEVKISFTYTTPGLFQGVLITLSSITLFIVYIRFSKNLKAVSKKKSIRVRKVGNFKEYCRSNNIKFNNQNKFERGDD